LSLSDYLTARIARDRPDILERKKLVAQVEKTFQLVGGFRAKPLKAEPPEVTDAEGARVELLFSAPGSPGARTRATLLALLAKARKRIYVGMFILSDPELVKAIWLRRGQVEIRVVIDAIQHRNLGKRVDAVGKQLQRQLKDLGESLRLCSAKQLHHKLALIDDVVVTGSANWSKAAWEKNHEVVAVLRPEKRKETPRFVETYRARLETLWSASTGQ
jgi:phosphatidylserine/phosphatidylglycerophosphate/cardiolipin synthase-like enzyme